MSASTMTSAASVWVLDVEASPMATPAHSPHGGKMGREQGLRQGRVFWRREAVVSLDTSRVPAMLLRCGSLIG
jgi:hypothetical protein